MSRKFYIMVGMTLGTIVGGYIPSLWGDTSILSMSALLASGVGGILGIWIAFRMTE